MNTPSPTKPPIAYRWALNTTGYPTPITLAKRGELYVCPLCKGQMIPRMGAQLQHHFGHESDVGCTPEAVTRAALRRWITLQMRDAVSQHRMLKVKWSCPKCKQSHSGDLLECVTHVLEGYLPDTVHYADVALSDTAGNNRTVFLIQDEEVPTAETLKFYCTQDIFTIIVPATITPASTEFIAQSRIAGAVCSMLARATNVIKDPEEIRKTLYDVVSRWPGYFYGSLEMINGVSNVLRMGNYELWLPPERWQEIVGGTRNNLGSGVVITMQTWAHPDGGQIWLHYAQVRDMAAVGIRRYAPGQTPIPHLDVRFRHRSTTALDMVKMLINQ